MPGRLAMTADVLTLAKNVVEFSNKHTVTARYNIPPLVRATWVIRTFSGHCHLDPVFWGLLPSWATDHNIAARMITTPAERIPEKPYFRKLLGSQRCLVITTGFYIWQRIGSRKFVPWYFFHEGLAPIAFAGLWDRYTAANEQGYVDTCTIVTKLANRLVKPIANQMPAIVPKSAYQDWLDPGIYDIHALQPIINKPSYRDINRYAVSRFVDDRANDGPECIRPLDRQPEIQRLPGKRWY